MRVCIPTEGDQGLHARVAAHFGSAPYFTFVDVESGETKAQANPACHSNPGECHHVGMLRSKRVDAVVCGGVGRRALGALKAAGIDVLAAPGPEVRDALDALRAGSSAPLTLDAACPGLSDASPGSSAGCGQRHRHRHRGGAAKQEHRA